MRQRAMLFAVCAASAVTFVRAASADPLKIHVRGSVQLTTSLSTQPDAVVVQGEVVDDVGAPLPHAHVLVQLLNADGSPVALPMPAPCGPQGMIAHAAGSKEYALDTDEAGAFCVRAPGASAASARVRVAATKTYEGADVATRAALPSDAQRTSIRFEPSMDVVDLERDTIPLAASLRIERPDPGKPPVDAARREGLHVLVENERHVALADQTTGGDGRVRFELRTSSLGDAGAGELRLRFAGAPGLAACEDVQPIVRRALVSIALAHPIEPGHPDEGMPIDVEVTSAHGRVSGGVVEALRSGESVGAGNVVDGHARVLATFPAERAASVALTMRYVPAAPWWRPQAELPIEVRVSGPGIFKRILLALAVLGAAAWVLGSWRRAPKAARTLESTAAPPSGRAGVEVVASPPGITGWRGAISDAHEGTLIVGAELKIVVPAFDASGVIATTESDERGTFTLKLDQDVSKATLASARLVVASPLHSTHEQHLPPPSVLRVALVSRRRQLVDRLVRWARRHGAPFDAAPDPTPGHVRRAAARGHQSGVEAWAGRVEEAAFGPAVVDEGAERAVVASEPNVGDA